MKILCERNRGYKWINANSVYFKGFLIKSDGRVVRDNVALEFLQSVQSFDSFVQLLGNLEGCFSIIIVKREEIWAAVDIERTMPLYYSVNLDIISDDAEAIRKEKNIPSDDIGIMECIGLYGTSFIAGEKTIYEGIKQIDYRNAVCIKNGKINSVVYYKDVTPIKDWKRNDALREMRIRYEEAVRNAMKVVGDRTIVLSLSGGYDSRCLACTLKNIGADNVICIAYGNRDSFEIEVSKNVADALGYRWYCIEYSASDQLSILQDDSFLQFAKEHDYTIYLQNYLAIKKAKENGLIPNPEDAVFMVGLINDVTVGHYTPIESDVKKYEFNEFGLAAFIVDYEFCRFEIGDAVRKYYQDDVLKSIEKYGIHVSDYQTFVTGFDDLNLGRGHSRNYPKMNWNQEFYGYEWLMPFMDRKLMAFWRSIPVDMRIEYNLYEEFVTKQLACEYGVGQKKKDILNAKTPLMRKIKRRIGGMVVRALFSLGIPLKRKADINNFAPLEVALYKGIKQKKAVKPTRAGIRLLMDVYFMEKRYGTEWFKTFKGMIR